MKHLHSDHLFDVLLAQSMDDALSSLPPRKESEISCKAEDLLSSLPKEQNDCLRSYLNELIEQESTEKQTLYLQGILDGIALAGIVQQEQLRTHEQWAKTFEQLLKK